MKKIRIGDTVARKSYNKDILFTVEKILNSNNKNFAILSGVTIRILADAPIDDLEVVAKEIVSTENKELNERLQKRIERFSRKSTSRRFIERKKTLLCLLIV